MLDDDGDRWMIRSVDGGWVTLQNPDRGIHRLRTDDLREWVERERWRVLG